MKKEIELVSTHCKHKDCIYRKEIASGGTPFCFYAAMEHQARGCKISECDKYKAGDKIKPHINARTDIIWEYEFYDESYDL